MHLVGDLLAAGASGIDTLSVCVAALVAIPAGGNRGGWGARIAARNTLFAGASAGGPEARVANLDARF